ncbi:acyltransferase domain-containing protein [Alkalilimnicola sp. S0819]|nr:acyltransferase domain-containing protein [Alkalilimnicola sp. S0819]MPQ15388.1 acyltransferase domain-containing protein [Alkalilimnicola sp. S0819]
MGADLYAEEPVFRHWLQTGDRLLRDSHGFSVLDSFYGPECRPGEPFDRLEASHPALFLVQYALAKLVQHHGLRPDQLLGISLGEFTAMSLAGMLSFERALSGVATQPALYRQSCEPGGMVAVLGSAMVYGQSELLSRSSEIAGVSAEEHFVLAAPASALPSVEAELRARGLVHQRLPVPFAFHSRWIEPAGEVCKKAFSQYRLQSPYWPCWSSRGAGFVDPADADVLWRIVREPMNLRTTVEAVEARGGGLYLDLSPAGSVSALVRQVLSPQSPSRTLAVMSPFGGNVTRLRTVLAAAAERH